MFPNTIVFCKTYDRWVQTNFNFFEATTKIRNALQEKGYTYGKEFQIIKVPNIVDISYGRKVGYTITEHDLGEEVHAISATAIRKKLTEWG